METIKVLIANEHPVVREGVRAILETDKEIEVACEASNGLEAVDLTFRLSCRFQMRKRGWRYSRLIPEANRLLMMSTSSP